MRDSHSYAVPVRVLLESGPTYLPTTILATELLDDGTASGMLCEKVRAIVHDIVDDNP